MNQRFSARPLVLGFLLMCSPVALAQGQPSIERWGELHAGAATALSGWVKANPEAARRVFLWNRDHPMRSHAFIAWLAEQPDGTFDEFVSAHPDWPVLELVLNPNRAAVEQLIAWGHDHPEAVRDLAVEQSGFFWVGTHLFRPLWAVDPTVGSDSTTAPDLPAPNQVHPTSESR